MLIQAIGLALFSAVFGLLMCFAGYRFFMVMLPVWSFFGGCWIGAKGVRILLGEGFLATTTSLTVGFVLGILFAIFCWQFYRFGIALVGAVIGGWLGWALMDGFGYGASSIPLIAAVAGALVAGGLTYVRGWQQYLVMGLSAIIGANALVLAGLMLAGRVSPQGLQGARNAIRPILADSWLWLLVWLAIAIVGFIYQYRNYGQHEFVKEEFVKYWS